MGSVIVYFDEKEDRELKKFSDKWKLSKYATIKKILKEFMEKNNGNI